MLVSPESPPTVSRRGEATLVWMAEQPLVPGKSYWFKHTTRRTSCEIETIRFRTDVNTMQRIGRIVTGAQRNRPLPNQAA